MLTSERRVSREEVAARVRETRARQGLGPTIADPAALARLAAMVADTMVKSRGARGRTA